VGGRGRNWGSCFIFSETKMYYDILYFVPTGMYSIVHRENTCNNNNTTFSFSCGVFLGEDFHTAYSLLHTAFGVW
jgi:hypothetical protein